MLIFLAWKTAFGGDFAVPAEAWLKPLKLLLDSASLLLSEDAARRSEEACDRHT
jgi:hypothetical protein